MTAVMSSMLRGRSCVQTPVMPALSSWNTPEVWPSAIMWKLSASSSGMVSTRKPGSVSRTILAASSRTVRFRRPRKSIFSRPSSSRVVIWYWVTTDSSLVARGTYSQTGFSVMTTPAACVEAWRGMPSSAIAVSSRRLTAGSCPAMSRRGLEIFSASSSVMFSAPGPFGICLATASVSP